MNVVGLIITHFLGMRALSTRLCHADRLTRLDANAFLMRQIRRG